ncbi:MAG: PmbA/TldA family metallopeptidase, partial [Nocardioides sp.]
MMKAPTPQEHVEHALKASGSDDCIAIVRDSTRANLRWANNTLTTNGVMHDVTLTVVAFSNGAGGVAAGSVTASASTREQVERIVTAADAAAA